MASATSTPLSISSSSAQPRKSAIAASSSSQCVTPSAASSSPVALLHQSSRLSMASAYCRNMARNVAAMATTKEAPPATITSSEVETTTELPEFVKTLQDTWEKVEDKYAVTSLAVAGAVGLYATTGMISAIDRLPLVPGVLELVGIGYTGWFAYKNLIFKPEREALIQKIKDTYKDVISTS